ncbi:MAG: single-stranded DNA-binding protein [Bacteroidia bacterium]|nr:single-stranded DNA-binding protein [Bacteroidia bacterium]
MTSVKNRVQLLGNLGKDPEVKTFKNGKMAKISLAVTEYYKTMNGDLKKETHWHTVVFWGKNAEFAEKYLKKGSRVLIDGKIRNSSYEDKDGQKRYVTDIVGNEMVPLDKKQAA